MAMIPHLVPFHNCVNDPSTASGGLILAEILSLDNSALDSHLFPISEKIELRSIYPLPT